MDSGLQQAGMEQAVAKGTNLSVLRMQWGSRALGRSCAIACALLMMPLFAHAQSYTRTETIQYHDNTTSWILGQTEKVTCVAPAECTPASAPTGVVISETSYDALARPVTFKSFGRVMQVQTYNADGTIATVKDGNNNVSSLSNWKRGIPQTIQYPATPEAPAGAVESAVVNDSGWIMSVTDEVGAKTCYAYDAMGRVSQITYPSESTAGVCDASAWNIETVWFGLVPYAEHGLPAGHWTMSRRVGNRHVNSYYDAFWRPVLEESLDYADIGNTLSQVVKRYDHNGQVIFQSYPKRGVDRLTESQGVHTIYDALGRVTSSSQDSEHGLLTTLTEHLAGFQTRVTDPRGYQSVTQYQVFDQPSYASAREITQFAGADTSATEIHRDIFGKPKRIRKRNADGSLFVDRHYVYQVDQQLCKVIEPETGATVMGYDWAGNLTHSASGLAGYDDLGSCNHAQAWASGRVAVRTYDARNRLKTLAFPDGRGNQAWEYWPDGLPYKITTHNEALGAGLVENTYNYNNRRLLTGEGSTQVGWYAWGLGYGYDANGSLSTQTYPTGLVISYAPNALGQATQARDPGGNVNYATGASYYPNGAIKQFTYGNGIVHSMSQNARQLPLDVKSSGGVLHDRYTYDANGNVESILDVQDGGHLAWAVRNRYLGYDGLDRLTAAGSGSFGGDHWHRFTYNALDNMTSWKLGGVKDYATYVYDGKNQLGSIKDTGGATIVGFGYDLQGNVNNKSGQGYEFDYGNRLRDAIGKEWYRYDGHGRRVLSWPGVGSGMLSMYSNAGQVMYQEDYKNFKNHENIYLAGSVIAIRDYAHAGSLSTRFQHTDALGSPVAVTNQAGTVIERNNYEPYGAVIGKPNYEGIGYTGHVHDAATKLTYMQQRYYDPQVGLFLSVDPVTAYSNPVGMFNRYRYADNNPYGFTDPDGRAPNPLFFQGVGKGVVNTIVQAATWRSHATPPVTLFAKPSDPIEAGGYKLGSALGVAVGTKGLGRGTSQMISTERRIANSALVVRGGSAEGANSAAGLAKGTGNHPAGAYGFSAESANGASLCQLCANVSHNQVGVTTAGQIRAAGGDVVPTAGVSPNHVTVTGLKPEAANKLLTPTQPNPVPATERLKRP